jgi:hypothetical protein
VLCAGNVQDVHRPERRIYAEKNYVQQLAEMLPFSFSVLNHLPVTLLKSGKDEVSGV